MKKFEVNQGFPQFQSFLQGFNRRWFASNCEVVYLCQTTRDVEIALEEAISLYGGNVKIKSGGHCYENFVFNEETKAIIDITSLNDVGLDPQKGYYLGSGGSNWSSFTTLFNTFGKVLPSGSCYSVGLGGHISGGGYGLLSRLHGLTVDWLTGVELVVKETNSKPAHTIYVSKESTGAEQDLFWAQCGGGGGNFGVITKYFFRELPEAPAKAYISAYSFDWTDVRVQELGMLLSWFADFSRREDNWNQFGLLKLNHQSAEEINLTIQTAIDKDEVSYDLHDQSMKRLSKELRDILPHNIPRKPIIGYGAYLPYCMGSNDNLYTYYEATQTLNLSGPNQYGKYKSAYMRKNFSNEDVEIIFKHLTKEPDNLALNQSLLQIDSYGGKINTFDSTATPIPQRDSIFKLQYQSYWSEEKNASVCLKWIRDFYTDIYKEYGCVPDPNHDSSSNVDGCYYNYPDSDLNDIVGLEGAMHLYFLENLDRLKSTKQQWDPNNYFNSAQSIPLQ
ncbi:MAG: FAD-binding protein [Okeania sp. SIO3H1]|nr:FAD-binding protein [Okeania sp. SIO3H1]